MKPRSPMPARALLAVTAAVLAAHFMLLRAAMGPVHVTPSFPARPFVTRSIPSAPPLAAVAAPHPGPPRPRAETPGPMVTAHLAKAIVPLVPVDALARATEPATAQVNPAVTPAARPEPPGPAAPRLAFTIPGSMRLHYQVTAQLRGAVLSGQGELVWRHDGDSYEATLEVSAPLLRARTQRSTGRITAEGLAPVRFSDRSRTEEAAHFERDKGRVSFSSNRPDAPLSPGAQDRLSVLLQLGAMIAGDPARFPAGATVSIQTAGTRDAEPWLFTIGPDEELQLPGGGLIAVKITRNPRRDYDQKVELWLGRAMDYVPVRLRLTQPNGDSVDQLWSSTDRG